jgi:hypothetical protein
VEGAQIKYGEHAVSADRPPQVKDKLPEKLPQARRTASPSTGGLPAEGAQQRQAQHADSLPRSAPAAKKGKGSQHRSGRDRRRKRRKRATPSRRSVKNKKNPLTRISGQRGNGRAEREKPRKNRAPGSGELSFR